MSGLIPVKLVKATGYEMLGAFLREVAALILVFGPLDKLIAEGEVSASWWCGTFSSASPFFSLAWCSNNLARDRMARTGVFQ
jgi:hypothetical protein